MNELLSFQLAEANRLDKKKFVAKYPHPWLLSECLKLPPPMKLNVEPRSLPTDSMKQGTARRMVATKPSALALKTRGENFMLIAIVKSDRNLWADRVFVGRTANNDIVIDDPSVSKAHAYFVVNGTRAQLVALPSLNPTKLGEAVIAPQGTGIAVPDGAIVEFGLAGFRYLESQSLHALFTSKS